MAFRQGIDDIPTGSPPMIGKMLTDAEWLDYLANYDFGSLPPDRVVLHHTWSPTLESWRGQATMKGMQTYYRGKGWRAAPHIYVAPEGIWLFSPMSEVGIHAGLGNANIEFQKTWQFKDLRWYSIGVEMVGAYDAVRPSGGVWDHTKGVVGSLLRRFEKTPEQALSFHRDYTNTKSCPGWAVQKPWVFSEMNAWLAATNPVTGLTVVSAPRIDEDRFVGVLQNVISPARGEARQLYRICISQGIDPAVALAFFGHESTYGKAASALSTTSRTGATSARRRTRTWAAASTFRGAACSASTILGRWACWTGASG